MLKESGGGGAAPADDAGPALPVRRPDEADEPPQLPPLPRPHRRHLLPQPRPVWDLLSVFIDFINFARY